MLKQSITYVDFNDVERTEDFYFHLSKVELIEMETSVQGGMTQLLKDIVAANNVREIFSQFKTFIIKSVGMKSEDGKKFIKNDQISEDFVSSPAFDALFVSLATDAGKVADFMNGVMPADMVSDLKKQIAESPLQETVHQTSGGVELTSVEQG